MHRNSLILMEEFRDKYLADMKGATILDVGSMYVGSGNTHTYRELFESDFKYTGMDLEPGPNVDIVGYKNIQGVYDVVISGQVMEHVKHPWDWLKLLTQYFGAYICIIVPNAHKEHRHPLDTYRYFPDGMRDLFEYAGIKEVEIYISEKDTVGIGTKNKGVKIMERSDRSPQVARIHGDESGTMDFASALKEVMNGKRIRRLEWQDEIAYLTLADERLMVFKVEDKLLHPLIVSVGDMTGMDWVVVNEDQVIH